MKPRIVITDTNLGDGSDEHRILDDAYQVELYQVTGEDEVVRAATGAQGLLVQWAEITDRVLSQLPDLRAIVRYGIGIENVDVEAARRRGISVSNVPDYCVDEVADHAAACVYAHHRRLTVAARSISQNGWTTAGIAQPLPPVSDPVGIAGFGRVGKATAQRLALLGFSVHVWDPFVDDIPATMTRHAELVEMAAAVNHLSLHVPTTPDTRGVVDESVLTALGPAGHLINTARGALVDEQQLLDALDQGRLGFASLDVLVTEPPTGVSARLVDHPRVLATPHIAYLSSDSLPRLRTRAAEILRDLLETRG